MSHVGPSHRHTKLRNIMQHIGGVILCQRQLKLIGRTVLPTMPVVTKSRHTVVSEWGYGEAGLLKLT